MVINNKLTEIGDVLIFGTRIPLSGITSFASYSDVTGGVTATRTFLKKFRYSYNGVNWTDWAALTNAAVTAIPLAGKTQIYFDFWYERGGTDTSGELEFTSIEINGNSYIYDREAPIGMKSVFRKIMFSSPEVLELAINLTKKLYHKGIVPEYVQRTGDDTDGVEQDADYIALMKTIAHFFALFVIYFKEFENIYFKREFILEYLKQRNIFLSEDESINEFQYLVGQFYDEVRQRGTIQIVRPAGYEFSDGSTKAVNGELLRLIAYNELVDEFLFNVVPRNLTGWTVNSCSPLFTGMTAHNGQVNKGHEDTEDCVTPSAYAGYSGQIVPMLDLDRQSFEMPPASWLDSKATVDENVDYEFTFWIRTPLPTDTFSLELVLYSATGVAYPYVMTLDGGMDNSDKKFLNAVSFQKGNIYHFVRCKLYNKNAYSMGYITTTNLGVGKSFKTFAGVKSAKIRITSLAGTFYVNDIKWKPLNSPFSLAYLQAINFIQIWMKNNNDGTYSDRQVEDMMRYYLLPYNSTFKTIQL